MESTITAYGEPANLADRLLSVGENAPEVLVVQQDFKDFLIGGAKDKPQLILTVPSLDGEVCPREIEHFDEILRNFSPRLYTYVISMDLPLAQRRYCIVYGIQNLHILSDFRYRNLRQYGVYIASGILQGLLARAAFVVDTEGKITYIQLVREQTDEPDYEEVRRAVEAVLAKAS
ncbi:MAG: thiol peroxidase [Bacteroidia bacterium]|nr:thiol peroxidase [Bacteroidia bacterium]MCX7764291.1 thiol peroxidase [Bacteroidia bacterium]MDW8058022.1 thiol peroxidase [Bacteroidia bacterium]